MASFNKVILMGNLVRDPEMRVTANGHCISKISLAVSRSFKKQDGSIGEETTFVDVAIFGKQAETVNKHFSKGKPILVEGRLKLDQWKDKDSGNNRSRLGVVMEEFQFVGRKSDGGSGEANGGYPSNTPPSASEPDDDVPY